MKMVALFPLIAFVLSGCGKEAEPRSVDWYNANLKQRAEDRSSCRATPPTSDVGKQNCKNAEASEIQGLTAPSPIGIR